MTMHLSSLVILLTVLFLSLTSTLSIEDNCAAMSKPKVKDLNKDNIPDILGGIYEHSPWVAEELVATFDLASIETVSALAAAMKSIVNGASKEKKMDLLLKHPDLCQKVEQQKELTADSQAEQSKAGLSDLTAEELERFTRFNNEYKEKFGFPFILAVRNASKYTVLSALEGRIQHTVEKEFADALTQVHKIAWMRLLDKIDYSDAKGYLTCHILDTATGIPAQKMRITLHRLSEPAGLVGEFVTNDDGRLEDGPALKGGDEFLVGEYEWTFYVADYFASTGTFVSGTPFLNTIPLRFGIDNPDDHYHVPLLVSPWGFSTYRGS